MKDKEWFFGDRNVTYVESKYNVEEDETTEDPKEAMRKIDFLGLGEAIDFKNLNIIPEGWKTKDFRKKGPAFLLNSTEFNKEEYLQDELNPAFFWGEAYRKADPEKLYSRIRWTSRDGKPKYTDFESLYDALIMYGLLNEEIELEKSCKGYELIGYPQSRSGDSNHLAVFKNLPIYPKSRFEKSISRWEFSSLDEYLEELEKSINGKIKKAEEEGPEHFARWTETEGTCTCGDVTYANISRDLNPVTGEKQEKYPLRNCSHLISVYWKALDEYHKNNENSPIALNLYPGLKKGMRDFLWNARNKVIINREWGRDTLNRTQRNVLAGEYFKANGFDAINRGVHGYREEAEKLEEERISHELEYLF